MHVTVALHWECPVTIATTVYVQLYIHSASLADQSLPKTANPVPASSLLPTAAGPDLPGPSTLQPSTDEERDRPLGQRKENHQQVGVICTT